MTNDSEKTMGKVYLVGAGPGDPGLITLRGVECLQLADVILYDYLVNPQILAHAAPAAETICLGRHGQTGQSRIWKQEEINAQLVQLAGQGKTVVRLKGGDPNVFARGAEEIATLAAANIPYEIVPGVTASLAAGSYAGVPITHRDFASAAALITAQENPDKQTTLDYQALAKFPGTLVFYMGATTARTWTSALIEAGKAIDTPAVIIRRCSFPDQKTWRCTLGTIAGLIDGADKIRPPLIVIVGAVAALGEADSWFGRRPLFGRKVIVTRPTSQAGSLGGLLGNLGADVLLQPAIEITEPDDWSPVDDALARLEEFDWLVFSSVNGVRFLLERLLAGEGDLRKLGSVRLAAIGPGTSEELARYHLKADLLPREFRAEALAEALAAKASGKRFLLARASRGREVLAEELVSAGGQVEQVVVYNSTDVSAPDAEIANQLKAGEVDWITVTSSAIARSLVEMFGEELKKSSLASISPITSQALSELGFPPQAEAEIYTMQGVVDAIVGAKKTAKN